MANALLENSRNMATVVLVAIQIFLAGCSETIESKQAPGVCSFDNISGRIEVGSRVVDTQFDFENSVYLHRVNLNFLSEKMLHLEDYTHVGSSYEMVGYNDEEGNTIAVIVADYPYERYGYNSAAEHFNQMKLAIVECNSDFLSKNTEFLILTHGADKTLVQITDRGELLIERTIDNISKIERISVPKEGPNYYLRIKELRKFVEDDVSNALEWNSNT